jgi:NADH:ubiquinone oxidoreductase subunit E
VSLKKTMNVCCQEYKDIDLSLMDPIIGEYRNTRGSLIPVLQKVQAVYGWLPEPVIAKIAVELNVYMSQIYGVVTFYSQFYITPRGKHLIKVCRGTACHVKGSARIQDKILIELGLIRRVAKSDFNDNHLVLNLMKEKILREDEQNRDYVFFEDTINDEAQLRKRLGQAEIKEVEPVADIWRKSLEPEEITPDGRFTVEEVACVGACGIAPVVIIADQVFGSLTVGEALDAVKNFNPDAEKD